MLVAAAQHCGISDIERGPRAFSYRPALLLHQPCSSQKSAASNWKGKTDCGQRPHVHLTQVLLHPGHATLPTPPESRELIVFGGFSPKLSLDSSWQLPAQAASKGSVTLPKRGILSLSLVATFLPFCNKFETIKNVSNRETIYTRHCIYPSCVPPLGEKILTSESKAPSEHRATDSVAIMERNNINTRKQESIIVLILHQICIWNQLWTARWTKVS